jgi:hypothetical protein
MVFYFTIGMADLIKLIFVSDDLDIDNDEDYVNVANIEPNI